MRKVVIVIIRAGFAAACAGWRAAMSGARE
jgi:hypothetical protein